MGIVTGSPASEALVSGPFQLPPPPPELNPVFVPVRYSFTSLQNWLCPQHGAKEEE